MINAGGNLRGHSEGLLHDLYMRTGRELPLIKTPQDINKYVLVFKEMLLFLRPLQITGPLFLKYMK